MLGLAGSLLIHGLALLLASAVGTAPQIDFEFELPAEVEFGLTEGMELAEADGSPASAPVEASADPGGAGAGAGADTPGPDAGIDPSDAGIDPSDAGIDPSDAGIDVSDARTDAGDAGIDAGTDAGDAGDAGIDAAALRAAADEPAREGAGEAGSEDEGRADPAPLSGPAHIPPGAHIALRIDMNEVRRSPLAPEVRRLLAAIPDWELILAGSGIDPLDDLDRLLLASPNLQRSRLVIAGRHTHVDETGDGRDYIRNVVQRFGATRGEPTPWSRRHGVEVAPWPNQDTTERVIAVVGPRHFTITRPEDLQRTLSVAHARAERDDEDDDGDLEEARGPDALLSMGPGDAFTVEIEGARQFVRVGDRSRIPTRLRLAVRRGEGSGLLVRGVATYESPEQAQAAFDYWNGQRERMARNTMVRLMGLASALGDELLEVDGPTLRVHGPLTEAQGRLLLGYLEGMVRRPRRRAPRQPHPTAGDDGAPERSRVREP